MKYKALFLDIDGTTVVHGLNNMPSARVTAAIKKASTRIHVCLVTGRPLIFARKIIECLALTGPSILSGGTVLYDTTHKKVLHMDVFPIVSIPVIYAIVKKHKLTMALEDEQAGHEFDGVHYPKNVLSVYVKEIRPDCVDAVMSELEKIPTIIPHKVPDWDPKHMSIGITSSEGTKLHGIVRVAEMLGLKMNQLIGVGDSYNDFPLLMACGLKIAMGNAVPELKAIADFVAPSVEEDGVATVIEKYILNR
jgi:HAD superfamily hydrolase (TIGR01484 family)